VTLWFSKLLSTYRLIFLTLLYYRYEAFSPRLKSEIFMGLIKYKKFESLSYPNLSATCSKWLKTVNQVGFISTYTWGTFNAFDSQSGVWGSNPVWYCLSWRSFIRFSSDQTENGEMFLQDLRLSKGFIRLCVIIRTAGFVDSIHRFMFRVEFNVLNWEPFPHTLFVLQQQTTDCPVIQ
jgi:hypothetical protein